MRPRSPLRKHVTTFRVADPLGVALALGSTLIWALYWIGNRRSPGSHIERHQPWIRETLGKGFTKLTQTLLAPGVYDFTCGFKGFRRWGFWPAISEALTARGAAVIGFDMSHNGVGAGGRPDGGSLK